MRLRKTGGVNHRPRVSGLFLVIFKFPFHIQQPLDFTIVLLTALPAGSGSLYTCLLPFLQVGIGILCLIKDPDLAPILLAHNLPQLVLRASLDAPATATVQLLRDLPSSLAAYTRSWALHHGDREYSYTKQAEGAWFHRLLLVF